MGLAISQVNCFSIYAKPFLIGLTVAFTQRILSLIYGNYRQYDF